VVLPGHFIFRPFVFQAKAETHGPDSLTHDEARWLLRGYAKARILEHNVRRAKK
jgi:hypothetical protein